jgi:hypothetical protein
MTFYLQVPFKKQYLEVFKELEILGVKSKEKSNYDLFILLFVKYGSEIMKILNEGIDKEFSTYIENALTVLLELWGCRICCYK